MPSLQELFKEYGIDPEKMPTDAPRLPPEQVAAVLRQIGNVLRQAPSYRSLPAADQARILENTQRIADVLERPVTVPSTTEAMAPPAVAPPARAPSASVEAPRSVALSSSPTVDPFALRF